MEAKVEDKVNYLLKLRKQTERAILRDTLTAKVGASENLDTQQQQFEERRADNNQDIALLLEVTIVNLNELLRPLLKLLPQLNLENTYFFNEEKELSNQFLPPKAEDPSPLEQRLRYFEQFLPHAERIKNQLLEKLTQFQEQKTYLVSTADGGRENILEQFIPDRRGRDYQHPEDSRAGVAISLITDDLCQLLLAAKPFKLQFDPLVGIGPFRNKGFEQVANHMIQTVISFQDRGIEKIKAQLKTLEDEIASLDTEQQTEETRTIVLDLKKQYTELSQYYTNFAQHYLRNKQAYDKFCLLLDTWFRLCDLCTAIRRVLYDDRLLPLPTLDTCVTQNLILSHLLPSQALAFRKAMWENLRRNQKVLEDYPDNLPIVSYFVDKELARLQKERPHICLRFYSAIHLHDFLDFKETAERQAELDPTQFQALMSIVSSIQAYLNLRFIIPIEVRKAHVQRLKLQCMGLNQKMVCLLDEELEFLDTITGNFFLALPFKPKIDLPTLFTENGQYQPGIQKFYHTLLEDKSTEPSPLQSISEQNPFFFYYYSPLRENYTAWQTSYQPHAGSSPALDELDKLLHDYAQSCFATAYQERLERFSKIYLLFQGIKKDEVWFYSGKELIGQQMITQLDEMLERETTLLQTIDNCPIEIKSPPPFFTHVFQIPASKNSSLIQGIKQHWKPALIGGLLLFAAMLLTGGLAVAAVVGAKILLAGSSFIMGAIAGRKVNKVYLADLKARLKKEIELSLPNQQKTLFPDLSEPLEQPKQTIAQTVEVNPQPHGREIYTESKSTETTTKSTKPKSPIVQAITQADKQVGASQQLASSGPKTDDTPLLHPALQRIQDLGLVPAPSSRNSSLGGSSDAAMSLQSTPSQGPIDSSHSSTQSSRDHSPDPRLPQPAVHMRTRSSSTGSDSYSASSSDEDKAELKTKAPLRPRSKSYSFLPANSRIKNQPSGYSNRTPSPVR